MRTAIVAMLLLLCGRLYAQTVEPVIVEYQGKGEGRITLTNTADVPVAVVLEAKSFTIGPDGNGIFRPLDEAIHLRLSSTSARVMPHDKYYVFYSVAADHLPAWLTVYATFSPLHHGQAMDLRIMLPHTIYLYQKDRLTEGDVKVSAARFDAQAHKVICTLENESGRLARVRQVKVTGGHDGHDEADAAGFPFLPGAERQVEIAWKAAEAPGEIAFQFDGFRVKSGVAAAAP
ncbi:hypothetical protein [Silvibacterium sp.]|uniref:hypothetical protein n=1 Tax=Silvibacterium sp. TaxID=1964179 RepID=UPI0039E4B5DA